MLPLDDAHTQSVQEWYDEIKEHNFSEDHQSGTGTFYIQRNTKTARKYKIHYSLKNVY